MHLSQAERRALENLILQYGLAGTLDAAASICRSTASHAFLHWPEATRKDAARDWNERAAFLTAKAGALREAGL